MSIVRLLQEGVGELMREATVQLLVVVMQEEVQHLVGVRSQPNGNRQAYRWGQEDGCCVVDGQKVPVKRLRVRSKGNPVDTGGLHRHCGTGGLLDWPGVDRKTRATQGHHGVERWLLTRGLCFVNHLGSQSFPP